MRKILTIMSSVLILNCCSPRISNSKIETDFTNYIQSIQNGNYEKSLSYLPSNFWNLYNKEQYLEALNSITYATGYISADNPEVIEIGERIKIDNNYFKVIRYKTGLRFDETKVSKDIIEEYRSVYGENSFSVDTLKNEIQIINENRILSVFDKKDKSWKYLELDQNNIIKLYGEQTWLALH